MPTYEWTCASGHSFSARADIESRERPCLHCDELAARVQVYRINSVGFAKTPPAKKDLSREYKAFTEASAELSYAQTRAEANGDPVSTPPLAAMAEARAADLRRRGVRDTSDL